MYWIVGLSPSVSRHRSLGGTGRCRQWLRPRAPFQMCANTCGCASQAQESLPARPLQVRFLMWWSLLFLINVWSVALFQLIAAVCQDDTVATAVGSIFLLVSSGLA